MGRTGFMDLPILCAVATLTVSTCAGESPSGRERAQAAASLRAARASGAFDDPRAAFHLVLAIDEVAHGESLVRGGRLGDARRAFVRARLDAELALALQLEAAAAARARSAGGGVAQASASGLAGPRARP